MSKVETTVSQRVQKVAEVISLFTREEPSPTGQFSATVPRNSAHSRIVRGCIGG